MKKSIINLLFITLLCIISFEVLKESEVVISSVKSSLKIWQNNIFPSLFPFFIISNILISLHLPEILGVLFNNIMYKLFKINGNASFILFLSILSGFPSSAKYTKELLENNLIDVDDATKILTFTHFSNPLFVIGMVSSFISNKNLIIPILLSHYLGNIVIGLILRNYKSKSKQIRKVNIKNIINRHTDFGTILSKSINSAISSLLLILGTVTTFLVLTSLINSIFNFNDISKTIINGIFEITQGLNSLVYLNVSDNIKGLIAVFILSFGGLSIHMQILTIISDTKIKYLPYLFSRLLHSIISVTIFYLYTII